jgi:4-hydroxy-4-methyl-2-oxoglutarate aldolase
MVVDGGMFWLGKVTPTGMPAYFRGTGPESLSGVMPGDVVLGDEEGLFFIPPHLVKDAIDAAAGTKARDEWIKKKMDLRQYESMDLYGTPKDPALKKELEDYIKANQKP